MLPENTVVFADVTRAPVHLLITTVTANKVLRVTQLREFNRNNVISTCMASWESLSYQERLILGIVFNCISICDDNTEGLVIPDHWRQINCSKHKLICHLSHCRCWSGFTGTYDVHLSWYSFHLSSEQSTARCLLIGYINMFVSISWHLRWCVRQYIKKQKGMWAYIICIIWRCPNSKTERGNIPQLSWFTKLLPYKQPYPWNRWILNGCSQCEYSACNLARFG